MAITISGTTGIAGVDGSAGTPAVQGTDTNTGVFYPAADTVGVSTGGSERMRIDSSGNVGIGTSSPSRKLNLKGSDVWQKFEETAGSGRSWLIGTGTGSNFRIYDETAGLDRMAVDTSGNLQFNSGYGSVATGYGCRAWVNFNGTGTVAIRSSGNVSSITDNGVGLYTVNFTNAMPDTNYATVGTCNFEVDVGLPFNSRTAATGSVGVETYRPYPYNTAVDVSTVSVSIFR